MKIVFNKTLIVFVHKILSNIYTSLFYLYWILHNLFYKQEKSFEIYIHDIFEITYEPIDRTTKTATIFNSY